MVDSIIKSFDIWTDAQGQKSKGRVRSIDNISLEGIAHLRELILELAIRGKLVPQEPIEEAFSNLLIKKGAQKSNPEKGNLYKIPTNWEWWLFADLGTIASSSRVHQKDWQSKGIPFYRAREIVVLSKLGRVNNELFISQELFDKLKQKGIAPEHNDIMITGVGTIGVPYVVKKNEVFYFKDASVLIFKNIYKLYPDYLNLFLNSRFWNNEIHRDSMGTTVDTLTIARAKSIPIPVPPIGEQYRIVSKVEQLMALCDELEREKTTSLKTHQTLVTALLQTLTTAKDVVEVQVAWNRLAPYFDTLFCTEDSIEQLKQIILQLAILGRLVKQDPTDEPASELLENIEKEKEKLIKEGKIKKDKLLPEIKDEEKPFLLPDGWEWVRLGKLRDVRYTISYGVLVPGPDVSNGVPFVRLQDLDNPQEGIAPNKSISKTVEEPFKKTRLQGGEILIGVVGSIGKIAVAPMSWQGANIARAICRLIPCNQVDFKYMLLILQSPIAQTYFKEATRTLAQPTLNVSFLEKTLVPLPPFAEQQRIVAEVKELISLCEKLNERISNSQEIQNTLSKTIVENAVA